MQGLLSEMATSDEKFTVLMSVYNKEKANHLDDALRSILVDQIRKPDEIVLICDGPITQELDKIVCSYKTQFPEILKVYRLKENMGLGKALKAGLVKCTYNIVARADSDDVCTKDRFQVQMEFMKQHEEIVAVSSYIDEFYDDWRKPCRRKKLPLVHEEIVRMARYRNPINHMAVMFRKKEILLAGSYRHMPYIEDYDLWVRAIAKGYKLANINQYLVHARIGNGMVKRRGNKERITSWRILNNFMLKKKMINQMEYYRNMIAIQGFVYIPNEVREMAYRIFLRNS